MIILGFFLTKLVSTFGGTICVNIERIFTFENALETFWKEVSNAVWMVSNFFVTFFLRSFRTDRGFVVDDEERVKRRKRAEKFDIIVAQDEEKMVRTLHDSIFDNLWQFHWKYRKKWLRMVFSRENPINIDHFTAQIGYINPLRSMWKHVDRDGFHRNERVTFRAFCWERQRSCIFHSQWKRGGLRYET